MLLASYGGECAKCGSGERLTHDHVLALALALSHGGGHTWLNSQILCFSCNSSKQNRNAIDYRDWVSGVLVGFLDGEAVASRGDVTAVEELLALSPGEAPF
ncbi:HNH endonuclease [Paenibacillus sp. TRM 82003]|uniref:HNH endonuclease n=1 Tax=Kineococcus sp. TRM81007 TaxID=2925831 RepID=UPI001F569FC4|nr:HNH endonuclease [Kineococcus sp. TRM81007]MCI2238950.1 HNH endonuclease [Kineococcus sp. TRM81007]MCI3924369.1 HNH endonuclease [Paenibacillus sp. TRM 82003]